MSQIDKEAEQETTIEEKSEVSSEQLNIVRIDDEESSSSSLRRSSSWNLIYYRNLTARLKISMSVSVKMIYFIVWNKKHRLLPGNSMNFFF